MTSRQWDQRKYERNVYLILKAKLTYVLLWKWIAQQKKIFIYVYFDMSMVFKEGHSSHFWEIKFFAEINVLCRDLLAHIGPNFINALQPGVKSMFLKTLFCSISYVAIGICWVQSRLNPIQAAPRPWAGAAWRDETLRARKARDSWRQRKEYKNKNQVSGGGNVSCVIMVWVKRRT